MGRNSSPYILQQITRVNWSLRFQYLFHPCVPHGKSMLHLMKPRENSRFSGTLINLMTSHRSRRSDFCRWWGNHLQKNATNMLICMASVQNVSFRNSFRNCNKNPLSTWCIEPSIHLECQSFRGISQRNWCRVGFSAN